ncbi:hypothetical protein Ctob_013881, partial [Chrysochromulina tobinii]
LCLRFHLHCAHHLPGRVWHVSTCPLGHNGLGRRRNERPPCCRDARSPARAQSPSCAAGPGRRRPQPDQPFLCRQQPRDSPFVPANSFAALIRVADPTVTASALATLAALAFPTDAPTHAVPVPSGLWPDATSILVAVPAHSTTASAALSLTPAPTSSTPSSASPGALSSRRRWQARSCWMHKPAPRVGAVC